MIKKLIIKLYTFEYDLKQGIHNPLSTLTNFAYVLIGCLIFPSNIVLGSLLIGLGIASTGFHWVRNDCWHKADIVAIYYVFAVSASWLWFGNAGIPFGFILGGIAHFTFSWFKKVYGSTYSQTVIGVLGALCIIPFLFANGFWATIHMLKWFVMALAVGNLASRLDVNEDGIVYDCFHAIWHIFSGIGIYYLIT